MTQYLKEEVYKVIALTLDPDFRSFYDVTDKNPPPVDHPQTYKPSEIGEWGYMEESAALAARDNCWVALFRDLTPVQRDAMPDVLPPCTPGGPMAISGIVIDSTTIRVSFSQCVSIESTAGIEYQVNGGAWNEVDSYTKIDDTTWEFAVSNPTISEGDQVSWRYVSPGGIVDCEEAQPIDDQFLSVQNPPSAEIPVVFHAATMDPDTGEMLAIAVGDGPMSVGRDTDIWLDDYQGVYQQFGAGEPGWEGGRVVRNQWIYSEDFSNAVWLEQDGATKVGATIIDGVPCMEISFTTDNSILRHNRDIPGSASGDKVIVSALLRGKGNSKRMRLAAQSNAGQQSPDLVLDDVWRWYSYSTTSATYNGLWGGLWIPASGVKTGNFYVAKVQYENRNGSADTTNPGEYVKTEAAEALTVYGTTNGNTVTDNVVTEARGTDLPEMPWIVSAPQATNLVTISSPTGGWSTKDQVGITGEPNTALLTFDNSAVNFNQVIFPTGALTDTGQWVSAVLWVKRDTDETRFPAIRVFTNGGNLVRCQRMLNTATGVLQDRDSPISAGNVEASATLETINGEDWWKVVAAIQLESSGATSVDFFWFPAEATTFGIADPAAQGSCVVDAGQLYNNTPLEVAKTLPPIFTDGAEVMRSADIYTVPTSNHDDTEGTYYGEWTINGDSSLLDGFLNYIGPNANLYDGTNSQSQVAAVGVRKLGFVYGSGTMRLNVDGVWHAEGAYDGTLLNGALDFFRSATTTGAFRNVRRYAGKDESIIDGLMA